MQISLWPFSLSELQAAAHAGRVPAIGFLRDKEGHEIDAIVDSGKVLHAIEAKSGQTIPSKIKNPALPPFPRLPSPSKRPTSLSFPMSKARKTLADILTGRSDTNIPFSDLCHLLERGGFIRRQGGGSHVIFHKQGVDEILNLQPIGNKAKAYQVKQVRNLILKYQPDID